MKIKGLIILFSFIFLTSFTLSVQAQDTQKGYQNYDMGMMHQHGQMMMGHQGMMGMNQMSALMDSCVNINNMMMQHYQQMNAQGMMGGKMGVNSMMGMNQNLKAMAEQMKAMSQVMQQMTNNKEMMANKDFAKQMDKMHDIMSQTAKNLKQMTAMSQQMMNQMHKMNQK